MRRLSLRPTALRAPQPRAPQGWLLRALGMSNEEILDTFFETSKIDLLKGLPDVRADWILERDDTELLTGPTSEYGKERQSDPELANLRFEHIRPPRRAKAGRNVTQMHYARQGIITLDSGGEINSHSSWSSSAPTRATSSGTRSSASRA